MAAFPRPYLTTWTAPAGGAVVGVVTAAVFLLIPAAALEDLIWRSGIPAVLPVAAPPLGATARAVLALTGGALTAAVSWAALFLLCGPDGFFGPAAATSAGMPTLRKADAHPDAPARRPLSASDLGAPMPPVAPPVVQSIPADLDLPLAAFDPAAVPATPLEPVRAIPSMRPPVALVRGERIATVELPRMPGNDADSPSIEALLRRLEQGTRQRVGAR